MAKRFNLIPRSTFTRHSKKPSKPRPLASSRLFCSEPEPESDIVRQSDEVSSNLREEDERHEQVQKLQSLLQQGRTDTARRLIKSLVASKSPFSSPSDIFSLLSLSSPPMKPAFSSMLMSACLESRMIAEAMELYALTRKEGNTQKCLELYENMKRLDIKPTLKTYHPLISGCCKEGMELVERLRNEMLQFGLAPDRLIYNAMIRGYTQHDNVQKAVSLQTEMVDRGFNADKMTYNSLILGHFVGGKSSAVNDIVDDMKAKGVVPKADTYNVLVKGYCELKDFTGAYFWCREMFENGFLLNSRTFNELISGLQQEGRLLEAQIVSSVMSDNRRDNCGSTEALYASAIV